MQDVQLQLQSLSQNQQLMNSSVNQDQFATKLQTSNSNTEKQPSSIGGGVKMAKKNVEQLSKDMKNL